MPTAYNRKDDHYIFAIISLQSTISIMVKTESCWFCLLEINQSPSQYLAHSICLLTELIDEYIHSQDIRRMTLALPQTFTGIDL